MTSECTRGKISDREEKSILKVVTLYEHINELGTVNVKVSRKVLQYGVS